MPYKLSREKRNNVKQRILTGEGLSNIVTTTGVSKSTVLRMKKQINPNYTRHSAGKPSLLPSSTHLIVRLKLKAGILTSVGGVRTARVSGWLSYSAQTSQISRIQMYQKEENGCFGLEAYEKTAPMGKKTPKLDCERLEEGYFFDESRFNLQGSDGVEYTYRLKGDPLMPHNYQTRKQQGGGKVMVWGCMTTLGSGYACRLLEDTMNSDLYQHALGTTYLDTLRYYGLQHDDVIFQQDCAKCHASDSTYNWMDNKDMTCISD